MYFILMFIPIPFHLHINPRDEDDILSEELDQNEALVDSGMNDAARKGKFLLYWKTTTLTSTSTSYTVTYSLGTLECTPSGFTLSACGKK